MPQPPPPNRPGLLLVHPTLHGPIPIHQSLFLRWTRLHFRDLLSLPSQHITRALRFTKPHPNRANNNPPLFYTILSTSISVFRAPEYYAVSRRLDLEHTRELREGEDAVGAEEGSVVSDILEARFSVYVEVGNDVEGVGRYADAGFGEGNVVVGIRGKEKASALEVVDVQRAVLDVLRKGEMVGEGGVYSSVYRHSEDEAHPDGHPEIEREEVGGGEWLILVLIVGTGKDTAEVRKLEEGVGEWASGKEVRVGVWVNEVDMV